VEGAEDGGTQGAGGGSVAVEGAGNRGVEGANSNSQSRLRIWRREAREGDGDAGGAATVETYAPGPSLSADFTFVARDAFTNRAAAVNPLVPATAAETALFEVNPIYSTP
jgi:hypothetical protein